MTKEKYFEGPWREFKERAVDFKINSISTVKGKVSYEDYLERPKDGKLVLIPREGKRRYVSFNDTLRIDYTVEGTPPPTEDQGLPLYKVLPKRLQKPGAVENRKRKNKLQRQARRKNRRVARAKKQKS
jgi:hypothetical protein